MRGRFEHLNVKIYQNFNSYSFYLKFISEWIWTIFHFSQVSYWMSKYSLSYGLSNQAEKNCPVSPVQNFRLSLRNYWEQLSWNLNLKFLWNITLYVSFLKKIVALNLKLYRVSYTLLNLYWLEERIGFKGLF